MPNPYNTRSSAGNISNPQQENGQNFSQEMANQDFTTQNLSGQGSTMYQQQGQDDSYGDGIGQLPQQTNDFGQQQAGLSQTSNYGNQPQVSQTSNYGNQPQATGHEETLADKVENMLEKLASKITGSNNNV
ncbi:hypothetical protein INT47_000816 [Mucor saturninus]|uniref:Uncharacterized protein n=1 Tax=Mucor saturninus TaxID=64648 RepID=A0A8H7RPH6_9FUNG|nr:hypothetical protein INT47_000816 [Mucor saturninus]